MAWRRVRWVAVAAGFGVVVLGVTGACIGGVVGVPCLSTGLHHGAWIATCPVGVPRLALTVSTPAVRRGADAKVVVRTDMAFVTTDAAPGVVRTAELTRGVGITARVTDADGGVVAELDTGDWRRTPEGSVAALPFPDVPDGDYVLHVSGDAGWGSATADLPLALYVPAVVHVMSDRPLYKPGQTVLLRSLSLAQTDLTPLDDRPGQWVVTNPSGDEVMRERDTARAFGVADTTFPLDRSAAEGTWRVRWETGDSADEIAFAVRPFRLPRLSVAVAPDSAWFGPGDELAVSGVATYASGAPVADAAVTVGLTDGPGRWPIPVDWETPRSATTDVFGRFWVSYGSVPSDLVDRDRLTVRARVLDGVGESVVGAAVVVVSHDDVVADVVTELGDGLVGGVNNRAYVRVTTPDGGVIPGVEVSVTNPWDSGREPSVAVADADGVVALQIDPGDPVTVVESPTPVRVRPISARVPTLTKAKDVMTGAGLGLEDRRALDRVTVAAKACMDLAPGGREVRLAVYVASSGAVSSLGASDGPLAACVARVLGHVRLPPGVERTYDLVWQIPDSGRPALVLTLRAVLGSPAGLNAALSPRVIAARTCIAHSAGANGASVLRLHWRTSEGAREVTWRPVDGVGGGAVTAAERACVLREVSSTRLAQPADRDDMGVALLSMSVPATATVAAPRPMTHEGYELAVAVARDGAPLGETRVRLPVGSVPELRLRPTPAVVHPGDALTVTVIRGPGFHGDLPETLTLWEGGVAVDTADVDVDHRTAVFDVDESARGFLQVREGGASATVFVAPRASLSLALSSDQEAYRPGDHAVLTVRTSAGGVGVPAGVGLTGVDQRLGQLAPLLGPNAYGRVTVRVSADHPAFDAFDPRALALGLVRGENAASAAVLRVTSVPSDLVGDVAISAQASSYDPGDEQLLTAFYGVLQRLRAQVREWETAAPPDERMTPDRMVTAWAEALRSASEDGMSVVDAFGRPLSLVTLPPDLLAQVDPREVVRDGRRLPEDLVEWRQYVAQEVRR